MLTLYLQGKPLEFYEKVMNRAWVLPVDDCMLSFPILNWTEMNQTLQLLPPRQAELSTVDQLHSWSHKPHTYSKETKMRKGSERDWERENEQAMNQIEGRLEKWTCNMSHCLHVTWPAAPMRGTGWDKGKRAVMSNEMNQIEGRLARWTCNMSHLCLAATWPESKYEFKKTPEREKEMNQVHLQNELAATWPASKYKWGKKDLRKGKGDESDLARCTSNNMSHLCNLTSCCNILNQCFLPLSLLWAKQ